MNDYFYDEEYIIDDFSVSVKKGKGKKVSTTNNRLNKLNKKKTNYKPVYNKKHIRNQLKKSGFKK